MTRAWTLMLAKRNLGVNFIAVLGVIPFSGKTSPLMQKQFTKRTWHTERKETVLGVKDSSYQNLGLAGYVQGAKQQTDNISGML